MIRTANAVSMEQIDTANDPKQGRKWREKEKMKKKGMNRMDCNDFNRMIRNKLKLFRSLTT